MTEKLVNRDFCDERHDHTMKLLLKIDKSIDTLNSRLNWFYLTTVTMLATAVFAALGLGRL